tara:strand:+ start:931 stop:1236 length:306 start_codon:yes stop_codon:yes gene_type:complete
MKKFSIIFLILTLITFTAYIKNSTKKIEDKIYASQENLRLFKKELENTKLEYDYLSSSENLIKLQNQYFEDVLVKKDLKNIKIIKKISNKLDIEKIATNNE